MSEPMTSVEIEDVLSSIRRLVSEDLRPAARPVAPVPPAPPVPRAEAGKLLLTPALRVVEVAPEPVAEDGSVAEDGRVADASDLFDAPYRTVPAASGVVVPDVVTAAVQDGDFGFASAIEEAIDSGEGLHLLLTPSADDGEAPFIAVAEDARPPAASPQPQLDGVVVALGAAVNARPEEWEADDGDVLEPAAAQWQRSEWFTVDSAPQVVDDAWVAEAAWAQQDDEPEAIAEPVAAPAPQPEVWDEDQQRLADLAEAAAVAEIMAATAAQPGNFGAAAAAETPDDDEMTFDEEVLRDLVRDMIREELQGPLGERITRNVRKLVRAEISRALSSRDYD